MFGVPPMNQRGGASDPNPLFVRQGALASAPGVVPTASAVGPSPPRSRPANPSRGSHLHRLVQEMDWDKAGRCSVSVRILFGSRVRLVRRPTVGNAGDAPDIRLALDTEHRAPIVASSTASRTAAVI